VFGIEETRRKTMAVDNTQTSKDNQSKGDDSQSRGDNRQTTVAVVVPEIRPVIYDLGSRKKKYIRRLKNGRGELMAEVALAVEQVRANLPDGEGEQNILPVIFIYKKKKKGKKGSGGMSMLNPLTFPFNFLR
jgi:hypothetical protein